MCKSCLSRYVGNRNRSGLTRTGFNNDKNNAERVALPELTPEVKEVLAKKRRSGYVIPSARLREQSKVNDDG